MATTHKKSKKNPPPPWKIHGNNTPTTTMDKNPQKKSKKNAHQNLSEPTPDEPLRWGGPIVSLEGDEVWVAFWYECLVGWCFACGRNGHDEKECSMAGGEDMGNQQYREWMKAGTCICSDNQREQPTQRAPLSE